MSESKLNFKWRGTVLKKECMQCFNNFFFVGVGVGWGGGGGVHEENFQSEILTQ